MIPYYFEIDVPNLESISIHCFALSKYIWLEESIIFAWTDGEGTQLDILFSFPKCRVGDIQGGIQERKVFVSIMRMGAFAFEFKKDKVFYGDYLREKLFINSEFTSNKLAELFTGICKGL